MCFNSSFIVLINALFLSRILSRRCINEYFMFLRMRVIGGCRRQTILRRGAVRSIAFPLVFVPNKGGVAVVQMPPHSAFWPVLIGRDMMKSRWFSKSKSVCAGWSGKVPRLCAIWTPQCGGMKGSCVLSSAKVRN